MISRDPFQPQLLCDSVIDTSTHIYSHHIEYTYMQPLNAWIHGWVTEAQWITIHQLMPVKLTHSSAESSCTTQCKPLLLKFKIGHVTSPALSAPEMGWKSTPGQQQHSHHSSAGINKLAVTGWVVTSWPGSEPYMYRFIYRDLCSLELWGEEVKVCLTWPYIDSNPCKETRYRPVLLLAGAYFTSTCHVSP